MSFTIKQFGQWAQTRRALSIPAQRRLDKAWRKSIRQEAHIWRKEIVQGITKQAPGGQRFQKLSYTTIRKRQASGFSGRKALLRTGTLRRNIKVHETSKEVFVGVLRGAKTSDGRNLVNLALVHEEGRIVIVRVTERMKKYFYAMMRKSGAALRSKKGSGAFVKGILIIKIPARPFITPVYKKMVSSKRALARRMHQRIGKNSKGEFGLVL